MGARRFRILRCAVGLAAGLAAGAGKAAEPPGGIAEVPRQLRPVPALHGGGLQSARMGQALGLASADFDEDGVADLAIGEISKEGGSIRIHRGNPDVIYPHTEEAKGRREREEASDRLFGPPLSELRMDGAEPSWIAAGDFDADGHQDLAWTSPGAHRLFWSSGDGRGTLGKPRSVPLGGAATAFAFGELNRRDGLCDLAIAVSASANSRVLLFQSPAGALRHPPRSVALTAPASAMAIGLLDDDPHGDLVIGDVARVLIVSGHDHLLAGRAEDSRAVEIGWPVAALAIGDFAGDESREVAVLGRDGALRLLEQAADGKRAMAVSREIRLAPPGTEADVPLLLRARVSPLAKDDLVLLAGRAASVWTLDAEAGDSAGTPSAVAVSGLLERAALPRPARAALPMRLDPDAFADFVVAMDDAAPGILHGRELAKASAAAMFTVDSDLNTADSSTGDGVCNDGAGRCTLRAAIQQANATPGADTIHFAIPEGGVPTIFLAGASLPAITEAVTIDATTQPAGHVAIDGDNQFRWAFTITGGNSVVRGFVLMRCDRTVYITTNGGNVIEGNWIGLGADGTTPQPSAQEIYVASAGNTIGGTTPAARNVVAGADYGVYLGAGPNVVSGNFLGTDASGTADRGNVNDGIRLFSGNNNTIGGTAAGAGNLISGNNDNGVYVQTTGNLIQGNLIGVGASGIAAVPNDDYGIRVADFDNTIGGTAPAARNVVSGNGLDGIYSYTRAVIQGNHIGTNLAGSSAVPNVNHGVHINSMDDVLVGGTVAGARNLISGNAQDGVAITFASGFSHSNNNRVEGNFVGTDATGTTPVANLRDGVVIDFNDGCNTIGGTAAGAGNLISGNARHGILLSANSATCGQPNRIYGNRIGTSVLGTGALPNGASGIFYSGNSSGVVVGGTGAGESNRIAFNGGDGVASDSVNRVILLAPNEIFDNGGLGIDRGNDGVTANSAGSSANFPVITAADRVGAVTNVSGTLSAAGPAGLVYTIHFFSNDACDPSGHGEGKTWAGSTTVTVDANGDGTFSTALSPAVPGGRQLTASSVAPVSLSSRVSEFSACRLVTGDPTPPPTDPLSLVAIVPPQGGDTANVSVRITGQGIQAGATAVLRRAGFADVVAIGQRVDPSGGHIATTFPLAGAARGLWDVVVTNPDSTTATLSQAFEVVAAVGPKPWVDLLGRRTIRPSRKAVMHLIYGNRGDVDAHFVPIWIGGIPGDATVELLTPLSPMFDLPGPDPDYSQVPKVMTLSNGEKLIPLLLPVLTPNQTSVFTFAITVPTARHFELHVGTTDVMFGSPLTEAWFKCLKEIIGLVAELSPIVDCLVSTLSFMADAANLQLTGDSGWSFALSMGEAMAGLITSCGPALFPPAQVTAITLKVFEYLMGGAAFLRECSNAIALSFGLDVVTSNDPNVKIGPAGAGLLRHVNLDEPASYAVFFENLETATAPAQEVVVTDQLDPNAFDLDSFRFGPVAVADRLIPAPAPEVSTFASDLDLRPSVDSIARVTGQIDRATGLVTWRFISIDPATGLEEEDPLGGFLPPNTTAPRGEGAVLFFVDVKDTLTTGTTFSNSASIVFDTNPAIATPTWTNTVDRTPPASQVTSAVQSPCANFTVQWSGSDAGAGIAYYTLYVSENGGPYRSVLERTTTTSFEFAGHAGSAYAFYTVARDAAGNVEPPPGSADVSAAAASGGQCFYSVTPCRVLDTRWIPGPNGAPALNAGQERAFEIATRCGIPASAVAISANLTITGPGAPGHLTLFPAGTALPLVSSVNFRPGQTRANNVIVPLGANGALAVFNGQPAGTVDCIIDVNGYFQ